MRALSVVLVTGLALAAACTSREPASFDTSGGDAGDAGSDTGLAIDSMPPVDTGTPVFDAPLEATALTAQLRVANWSPDAPAAGYDVCLAPHGTSSWSGPLLSKTIGDAGVLGDSGMPSVQFPTVTNYLLGVAPGTYDVAIVAAGAGCASPVVVATDLPAVVLGSWYTMAIVGDRTPAGMDPGLSVVLLTDDSSATVGTAVRFLDMAPSIAEADFGEGTFGATFVPLATGVPFARLGTTSGGDAGTAPDSNGYVGILPPGGIPLSAHASTGATGDAAVAPNQSFAAGAVVTVALVGGKTGGAKAQLVVCIADGVVNQSAGLYSGCVVAM
jgi:hypothetical protein